MNLKDKKLLLIGGAGLIGSHTVDELLNEDVAEIRIFDNLTRGSKENLAGALSDPRVNIFPLGGELMHRDILDAAMKDIDGVFHFAALWLLHCWDYPRSAFEVNIGGTFNVLEAMINNGVQRLVYSSSASVYGDAVEEPSAEKLKVTPCCSRPATRWRRIASGSMIAVSGECKARPEAVRAAGSSSFSCTSSIRLTRAPFA